MGFLRTKEYVLFKPGRVVGTLVGGPDWQPYLYVCTKTISIDSLYFILFYFISNADIADSGCITKYRVHFLVLLDIAFTVREENFLHYTPAEDLYNAVLCYHRI